MRNNGFKVYLFTFLVVLLILLFFVLLPVVYFRTLISAQFTNEITLLATIGGIMGAIFTVGGLVVALAAILTVLTIEERVNKVFDLRLPELRAHIYSYDAEIAIRDGNWEQADSIARQAIQEYPKIQKVRREIGLYMSNSARQFFIQEHRREGVSSLQDELSLDRNPYISLMFTSFSHASVERAIFWLKEAQKHGEDQDGAVSAALAKM